MYLVGVVQFTFYWRAEPTQHYWHATNPALPARSTCCFASVTMPHIILYSALLSILTEVSYSNLLFIGVQLTQHYWHATNPALPARYLLLRERYYAPYLIVNGTNQYDPDKAVVYIYNKKG